MRKRYIILAIAPLVLLGSVFAAQHIQANRLLAALAERPLPDCGERYRLLADIPDRDQNLSLIRYLLQ